MVGAGDGDASGVGAAVEGTDAMELIVVLSVVAAATWALAVLSLVLHAFTEVARWAAWASSREWPAILPPGLIQVSTRWPMALQFEQTWQDLGLPTEARAVTPGIPG